MSLPGSRFAIAMRSPTVRTGNVVLVISTIGLLDASATTTKALGAIGLGLGVGGLPATIVALELVFPVMVALLLADIALAVLARVAPQFGIFSIGLQIKVALALGALLITMPLLMPRLHSLFAGMIGVSVAVLR